MLLHILSVPEAGAGSLAVGPKHPFPPLAGMLDSLRCKLPLKKNPLATSQEHTSCTASGLMLEASQEPKGCSLACNQLFISKQCILSPCFQLLRTLSKDRVGVKEVGLGTQGW